MVASQRRNCPAGGQVVQRDVLAVVGGHGSGSVRRHLEVEEAWAAAVDHPGCPRTPFDRRQDVASRLRAVPQVHRFHSEQQGAVERPRLRSCSATRAPGRGGRRGTARCRDGPSRPTSRRRRRGGGRCAAPRRRRRASRAVAATPGPGLVGELDDVAVAGDEARRDEQLDQLLVVGSVTTDAPRHPATDGLAVRPGERGAATGRAAAAAARAGRRS